MCSSAQDEEGRRLEPNSSHVDRAGEFLGQHLHQAMREILVEEELHGRGSVKSFLSRSAAKARVAWMSSASRSGKSARIRSGVIPAAR